MNQWGINKSSERVADGSSNIGLSGVWRGCWEHVGCVMVEFGKTVLLAFALGSVCGERKLATERVLETIYTLKRLNYWIPSCPFFPRLQLQNYRNGYLGISWWTKGKISQEENASTVGISIYKGQTHYKGSDVNRRTVIRTGCGWR